MIVDILLCHANFLDVSLSSPTLCFENSFAFLIWMLHVIYDDELSIIFFRRTYEYQAGFGPLINMGQLYCWWDVLLFKNS
jgi:hypothetical protein